MGLGDRNRTCLLLAAIQYYAGFDDNELDSPLEGWANRLHPEERDDVLKNISAYLEEGISAVELEFRFLRKDGSYAWILGRGIVVRNSDGKPYRMTGSVTDITERKASEQLLIHQALYDGLTGLPNRTLLRDRVAQAIRQADRGHTKFALLLMDLDRF